MAERISTLDEEYQPGDLSVYPEALDDTETLYEERNNAETTLKQSLSYNARHMIVDDGSKFPPKGLVRVGPRPGEVGSAELIYYGKKNGSIFSELIRGFAGSRRNIWPANRSWVSNAVMAEHHNAVKDAIINIQNHLGTRDFPDENSLNGILKSLEARFLAPRALFRAYPLKGKPGTDVRFQNFSEGDVIRYLWDFGDGTTSVEKSPNHVYHSEGFYTVKLNIVTSTGSQGSVIKSNYIKISEDEITPFFYVRQDDTDPRTYHFVDQTDGGVVQRFWVFDDGTNESVFDPDVHATSHTYTTPGEYKPTLLIVFADQGLKRAFLSETIVVT